MIVSFRIRPSSSFLANQDMDAADYSTPTTARAMGGSVGPLYVWRPLSVHERVLVKRHAGSALDSATVNRIWLRPQTSRGWSVDKNVMRTMFSLCSKGPGRTIMFRAVFEEALALTSLTLFLAMVAVWAQVLGVI